MTGQLPLPFVYRPALGRADFLISGCNEAARGWIDRWPDWPGRVLVLCGPPGSGKTHLARLWIERSTAGELVPSEHLAECAPDELAAFRAVAIDDAENAPEQALLHLYNCCIEAGTWLLIIARMAPPQWPIALPDLASRLRAAPAVTIEVPDDHLLAALIVKQLADRHTPIKPNIVAFLLRRMERSFVAAAVLAQRLERLAMADGGPITLTLARQALAEIEAGG